MAVHILRTGWYLFFAALTDCQSGVWLGSLNTGRYKGIGNFTSQYNGFNSSASTLTVYALGGNSTVNKDLGDGQGCTNTWALTGYAGGVAVASGADGNPAWSKSGSIVFQVPANSGYMIVSNPLPSEGCSPGHFTVYTYQ
ncbi:TPA: prepilin, shufflon protein A [Serratia marcescens]|nr:prepilin, shufflon protein A [Serratia marcescens]